MLTSKSLYFVASLPLAAFAVTAWSSPPTTKGETAFAENFKLQAELSIMNADGRTNDLGRRTAAWHDEATGDDWLVAGVPSDNADTGSATLFERVAGQSRWKQITTLRASDGMHDDSFGAAVAIKNGVIAIGAPDKLEPLSDERCHCNVTARVGAVYFFDGSGPGLQTWKQRSTPFSGSVISEQFANYGSSLAFSKNVLAIGAPGLGIPDGGNTGAVVLYDVATGHSGVLKPTSMAYKGVGQSVAITTLSSGLDRLVASSYDDDIGDIYVFEDSGTSWRQITKLSPDDGARFDGFGGAVAIDGDEIVVGSPAHNASAGKVYSFVRNGLGDWVSGAHFDPPSGHTGTFGQAIALLGPRLAISEPFDSTRFEASGAVHVYDHSASSWSEIEVLHGVQNAEMGESVDLVGDTLIAGSPGWNRIDNFSFDGANWQTRFPIFLTGAYGDNGENFGQSVSISGDTAVVAATSQTLAFGGDPGVADVFVRNHSTGEWSSTAALAYPEPGYSAFGFHACDPVLVDGDFIFVGIPDENFGAGAVHIYQRSGTNWNSISTLTPLVSHTDDLFGCSLALAGNSLVIGSPGLNSYSGGAYLFSGSGGMWSQAALLQRDHPMPNDYAGEVVSISRDSIILGAPFSNGSTGAAFIFAKSTSGSWDYDASLFPPDRMSPGEFGASVSISGDRVAIGAPNRTAGSSIAGAGSVYTYEHSSSGWGPGTVFAGAVSNGNFGSSVLVDHEMLVIGEPGRDNVAVYTHGTGGWSTPSNLILAQPSLFGSSLGISNEAIIVGAPNGGNGEGGRAYIYDRGDTIFADGFQ